MGFLPFAEADVVVAVLVLGWLGRGGAVGGEAKLESDRSVPQASQQRYLTGLTRVQMSQAQDPSLDLGGFEVRSTTGEEGAGFVDIGIGGGSFGTVSALDLPVNAP